VIINDLKVRSVGFNPGGDPVEDLLGMSLVIADNDAGDESELPMVIMGNFGRGYVEMTVELIQQRF
jgi:hypothetical protein